LVFEVFDLNRIGYIKKEEVVTIAACLYKDFNLVIQTLQEIKESQKK
jgi:Ca2+-binding EF-hand superfamily protein